MMRDSEAFWSPDVVSDRFWSRVDASGDCWTWTRGTNSKGYGYFRNGSRQVAAHRFAWENLVGPIPSGLAIDQPPGWRGPIPRY